jgi:hypothetical protein
MVETRLQKKKGEMDTFGQRNDFYNHQSDMNLDMKHNNLDMGSTSNNPFDDLGMELSSHNPFEYLIQRNEKGEVYEEDI